MPRYIDLDKIPKSAYWCRDALVEAFERADIVDAVEVIRCKDCKHYYFADTRVEAEQCHVCGYWDFEDPKPDGFCSFAERREDA